MKTNAPEKIYIIPMPNHSDGYVGIAWDEHHKTMVEYTRTDAFIEKTEEYMYKQLNEGHIECANIETFLENYKKFIKGE